MLRGDSQRRAPAQTPTQPAQPTSAAPATAPYEIRATIIARASYKGLCLKSLVQAFLGFGGTSHKLEDKYLVKQEALQNKFTRYEVVIPVDSSDATTVTA